MPNPRTLLDHAGAHAPVASLGDASLVVIDPQREYLDGALPLVEIIGAIAETRRLLHRARMAKTPIFHVLHHAVPGAALFDPNGRFADFIPDLAPEPSETIIVKRLPNGFAGTELEARLRETGRSNLILAGFATHMCISATARAAIDKGFRNTIVADATATRDLPAAYGTGIVAAQDIKRSTLAALADRFAKVIASSDDLAPSYPIPDPRFI
jgi:nicotinamidase-related amidase